MKIIFLVVGKTNDEYLKQGIALYENRIKHYLSFETIVIPELRNTKKMTTEMQKEAEGILIEKYVNNADFSVLLDENGKEYNSTTFSKFIENKMIAGSKNMLFIVGGPYGFSTRIYDLVKTQISLSQMTFSHQMVRLFFVEQLYRAMTIIKGEPYHHQ
ncbi:MAG TPA: 23S rRNA (pseudouridine(1915)-N(3))-methyltransferase RlmH [Bacteroidales bacterium]|nr:MAG: 23S rRNA (pseudouridine(1915)-N(3))-methyltransferase RlmH [Bacteroidetes bacterium GWF2_33_38]OFY88250.1 MAG: 23S rRNA (pseudouridine(1915)-N(3))-methyltransferase RlmH [Bacteroidetes bacterium RIFOXYA2_FULL_33_7]HBF89391.1 23S rRNA (pseudouridine(1915)-N(3))-methyltransferase RlmH [Bacteroidales bacterium]